jgi:hypothetical protein
MNTDALIAWMYVVECIFHCPKEVQNDGHFVRLMVDLRNAYPDEYEFVVGFVESLTGR